MKNLKIKAALITIGIQLVLAAIIFADFLLDTVLGAYINGFYFNAFGSLLVYKITLNRLFRIRSHEKIFAISLK